MRLATRVAAGLVVAGAVSLTYQTIAEARDRRRFQPPGRLVGVGPGRRLHLVTAGEGAPAVVIIPALADNVLQWLPILEGVAAETRAIVYDRAGVGWSDPPRHRKRTPGLMAADLYALLHAAGIAPPYVLVGHSIGGIVARRFCVQFRREVAGILLVDSSHEDQARRFDAADWRSGTAAYSKVMTQRQARILGARRLAVTLGLTPGLKADLGSGVPLEYADTERAIMLSTRQRRTVVREMLMMTRLRETPPNLGSIPLTVLTRAAGTGESWPVWAQLQDELAALSTESGHIYAQEAGHYIHLDEPELIIQAIRDLVSRCR